MASKFKIFHIGYHKTATSSFEMAYETLGFKLFNRLANNKYTKSVNEYMKKADFELLRETIENHDAFSDNPWFWNDIYLELDKEYPESKFVFTTRDPDKWFASLNRRHINMNKLAREALYQGMAPHQENKKVFLDKYNDYNKRVVEYFSDRENFIHIDIESGADWKPLCDFLGKDVPKIKFPHKNKSNQ